jgi:hypothetical protein
MRFDINEALLRHIATGGGAAFTLRTLAGPKLTEQIAELFSARSDIRRLRCAQKVAKTVLLVYDFNDIMLVRDIVAQQELRRLILYSKQKDHTAHTVYLFLLGIWFFDHVSAIRSAVTKHGGFSKTEDACKWFIYQWLFGSLLHDIGYAFYDLSEDTIDDRTKIDGIYTWEWLKRLFDGSDPDNRKLKPETLTKLKSVHDKWFKKYGNPSKMLAGTGSYGPGSYKEVLERLAAAPWLCDLDDGWVDHDIFNVLTLGDEESLRTYAMDVAKKGYDPSGNSKCVDHAVASGLLLFQYTTYWYWLMNELSKSDQAAYNDAKGRFDYSKDNMRTLGLVEACRAVAYHNVQPSVSNASRILDRVTLNTEPILFLAIVCDELQIWDRYPAGDAHLRMFEKFAEEALEGGEIELACSGTDTTIAIFRIQHSQEQDQKIVAGLNGTLRNRLSGYEDIVSIEGT